MIETFLQKGLRNPLCFDTLKELEEYVDSTLNVDDVVTLLGVVAVGDGLGHQRIIKEADDGTGVILKNGLYANIIANSKLSDKANKAVQIVAGMGIKGGGTLGDSSVSLDIESVDDGLEINSDNIRVNIVDDLKTPSSTRPLSARQGMKLDTDKINFSDIVNDLTTGGTNKVASAEMLKVLKQIIDSMGEGGVAKLAAQLKSAEKSRIPSYGTLPAGGSMIVATSGIIIDPKVYIGGELVNPDQYTIDYVAATITLTTPVKYQSIFFIDDNYAPRFKFSVSTVNFLVNAPTLKNKLALGDVIDIQGESDANDGGHHTRVVENVKKLNGVDLGGGLFLNEVPNSRPSSIQTQTNACYQGRYDDVLDANDLKTLGGFRATPTTLNLPLSTFGVISNTGIPNANYMVQEFSAYLNTNYFRRIYDKGKNLWSSWIEVVLDSPEIFKYRRSLSASDNLNDLKTAGTYIFTKSGGVPTGAYNVEGSYGAQVEVYNSGVYFIQRITYTKGGKINCITTRAFDQTWTSWVVDYSEPFELVEDTHFTNHGKVGTVFGCKTGNIVQISFGMDKGTTLTNFDPIITFNRDIFISPSQFRAGSEDDDTNHILIHIDKNSSLIKSGRSGTQTAQHYAVFNLTLISLV